MSRDFKHSADVDQYQYRNFNKFKKDLKKDFFFSRNWIYQSQFQQPHLKRKLNVWLTMNTLLSYSILRS